MADQQPLAFRLLRLKPPSLHLAPDARFNLEEDFGTLPLAVPPVAVDGPFADRIQLRTASQMGVTGTLVLPQSFGAVYLGQTLTLAIAMQNTSRVVPLHRIGIKIEVVTDRGKVVLYDSTPSEGLSVLAPGEYHELLVKHDVKDQGSVTMVVKAWYLIAGGSERKYQGGSFVFSVENPLIVRTRHRDAGNSIFVETVLQNETTDTMLLESIEFISAPRFTATRICPRGATWHAFSPNKDHAHEEGPLGHPFADAPLLRANGGAESYVFCLQEIQSSMQDFPSPHTEASGRDRPMEGATERGASPRSPKTPSKAAALAAMAGDSSALGKLDIRWRGPMGDRARLQTQIITGAPQQMKELSLALVQLSKMIYVDVPFEATLTVCSHVARSMGPLKVSALSPSASEAVTKKHIPESQRAIVMDGLQSIVVEHVPPESKVAVTVKLLSRAAGRQFLPGLMLTDGRDGRVFDTLQPIEVYAFVK